MDRRAWEATVHEVARVGQNLATKPPTTTNYNIHLIITLVFKRTP